jgi:hypothetical protein
VKKTLKLLRLTYYSVYLTAIIAAFSGYTILKNGLTIDPKSDTGVTLQSILILFIIGSIPLTLATFNRMTKKWAELNNIDEKIIKYRRAGIIRIIIIGLGLILGVVFFYVMQSQSMIFIAGIAAVALFFCKPSENKIIIDLKIEESENE